MSYNRESLDEMIVMGLPYEMQLEQEISRLKEENAKLKESMDDSIRAHRAMINELQKQVSEYVCVEAERDQLKTELEQVNQGKRKGVE